MQTPWAIILCKFKNSTSEQFGPPDTQRMKDLFTSSGSGKLNMVDFFRDMSHGVLDLTGSKVFGWYPLDRYSTDWIPGDQESRKALIQWGRDAAIADNQVLSSFFSVVVITSPPTDLFGGSGGAVSGDGRDNSEGANGMSSLSPSLLGQEMGHVYGLQHSNSSLTGQEYSDSWDVMSNRGPFMAPHPHFTELGVRGQPLFLLGPGLNAANMWSRSWLDTTRVWTAGRTEHEAVVELRPLHRRNLPGYLVARVGSYFVEFRMPERWDAGIPSPVVLVHEYHSGCSYLQNDASGKQGLGAGDTFQQGTWADPFSRFVQVHVLDIDANARRARLRISQRPGRRLLSPRARIQVGVASDGGGLIIVGGKPIKVPPHSPLLPMVEALATVIESDSIGHGGARDLMRRDALEFIGDAANAQRQRMLAYHEPAPARPASGEGAGEGPDSSA